MPFATTASWANLIVSGRIGSLGRKGTFREEKTRGLLREMAQVVENAGARLLVFLIPDVAQLHYPEWQVINRRIEEMCRALGIRFLDLTPSFEASPDVMDLYLLPGDAHTSPEGHELIAAELLKLIEQNNLLP